MTKERCVSVDDRRAPSETTRLSTVEDVCCQHLVVWLHVPKHAVLSLLYGGARALSLPLRPCTTHCALVSGNDSLSPCPPGVHETPTPRSFSRGFNQDYRASTCKRFPLFLVAFRQHYVPMPASGLTTMYAVGFIFSESIHRCNHGRNNIPRPTASKNKGVT